MVQYFVYFGTDLFLNFIIVHIHFEFLIHIFWPAAVMKDKNAFSVLKEDKLCPTAVSNSLDELVFKDKQYAGAGGRDERGHVIEDSVLKLFNDLGGRVRKRSPDRLSG